MARALHLEETAPQVKGNFMQSKALKTAVTLVLGVAFSMVTTTARADESAVESARAMVKAAPGSSEASFAYGKALRRAS